MVMLMLVSAPASSAAEPRRGVWAFTASTQAMSSATGSKEANIPTLGTMAISFSGRQSQLGDTSMTSEMWKQGRPSTTALVYSAIFRFRLWWSRPS